VYEALVDSAIPCHSSRATVAEVLRAGVQFDGGREETRGWRGGRAC
jgi:hypothetical protein